MNSKLTRQDHKWVKIANNYLQSLKAPLYSGFRVVALLTFRDQNGDENYVLSTNTETVFHGGSVCAERSCVCKYKELQKVTPLKMYLVSDDEDYIVPGLMCREFLYEHLPSTLPIVMYGKKSSFAASVESLYPHPSIYAKISPTEAVKMGTILSRKLEPIGTSSLKRLYQKTLEATCHDSNNEWGPIKYASGALFSDDTDEIAWQDKLIEYCTTTDPVSRLMMAMHKKRHSKVDPIAIIQVDQFGIMHAPFSPGRSNLYENGFRNTFTYVHNLEGKIITRTITDLCPEYLK